ncbi:hypothetical protein Dimus_010847 [Dionaea muscipula]
MSVIHLKKKDVVKSSVKGVIIEFDHEKLATILGVPGNNGICEYIKDVWEESRYTKPLEITKRFANDENLTAARRVKSGELKPFQRFIHFLVMKNMSNDKSYVISMKDHELPYGDWFTMVFEEFGVSLVNNKGEEPKRYNYFEETFLTMCKLTRENGVWWIGSGENRRRDDDVDASEEEAEEEEEGNKADFDWEAVIDEAAAEGESGSGEKLYDAEDKEQGSPEVNEEIPETSSTSSTRRAKRMLRESTLVSYLRNSWS